MLFRSTGTPYFRTVCATTRDQQLGRMIDTTSRRNRALSILATCFLVGAVVLSSTGCNVQGFFTSYGDDPVWVDPDAPKDGGAAAADAGGPGKAVFGQKCASCHLGTGKGVPGNNIPALAGSALATGDATVPIRIVLHGLRGPIERNGVQINGQMASWKDQLSDQDIADVLTYVRSAFGNSAGAVTADEVADVRGKTTSRVVPYTEAEVLQPL